MPEKVILDPHFRRLAEIFTPEDLERVHSMADVVWGRDEPMPADELAAAKKDAVAIITGWWRHGSVKEFPKLRAILEVAGTLPPKDLVDYEDCLARGIRVLSCAPAFGPSVAEMALAMTLAAARDLVDGDAAIRAGAEQWQKEGNANTFHLFDQTVGFIGFGGLARNLKPLLIPFRPRILVSDPWLTKSYLRTQGVEPVDLDTLLSQSKVIYVLAIPSKENKALLGREELARIQKGALLVLISRSHLVDFDALTEMLMEGRLRAAIDVFPTEPLPADHPIRRAPGTVLSAHRAGGVAGGYPGIGRMVANDLEAILAGLPPQEMQSAAPEIIRRRD
ncbi:MAG TPA: NAD(P)-dependent oxidoreductase [Capsulimonadaceae bacterium]|nr:NAD(P)-dependent oxidoreductase [Capsulimonadaceae bacterium]